MELMTRGRMLLCELTGKGKGKGQITGAQLARLLKVSAPSLFAWQCGRSRPESKHRDVLEVRFGIPATSWRTDEEQRELDALKGERDAQESAA